MALRISVGRSGRIGLVAFAALAAGCEKSSEPAPKASKAPAPAKAPAVAPATTRAPAPAAAPAPPTAVAITALEPQVVHDLFVTHCAACHGIEGHGDGPAAEQLFPKPRAFADSPFRFAATGGSTDQVVKAVETTIRKGMVRSSMPGFEGTLNPSEVRGLADYVVRLTEKADKNAWAPVAAYTPPASVPKLDRPMITRGAQLFKSLACVNCHGETGHGDGPEMAKLADVGGRPIRPADLASGLYKSGSTPEDLYRAIIEGVPGTPMIAYGPQVLKPGPGGQVDDRDAWSLVAFVRSLAPPVLVEGIASGQELRPAALADAAMLSDPTHAGWLRAQGTSIAMRPLWQRGTHTTAMRVTPFRVGEQVGFRLEWKDETLDIDQGSNLFPDGVAVMYAMSDAVPALPMGVTMAGHDPAAPVNIWHWKASRQFDAARGYKTPGVPREVPVGGFQTFTTAPQAVEAPPRPEKAGDNSDLHLDDAAFTSAVAAGNPHEDPALVLRAALDGNAEGFGTLEYQPADQQDIGATAVWGGGSWFVTLNRAATNAHKLDAQFGPGQRIAVAFAVWNGSNDDRNGLKLISGWHWLVLDK
ncbi:MAG: c-type cytochrome [Phycisphaerae bacterium]|nr:c-type cytochrome [Phycisphaerae bacterium]